MEEGFSPQFSQPCVVVTDRTLKGNEIIDFAREIDAVYNDGRDDGVIVDIKIGNRRVGPEFCTFSSIRRSFKGTK